MISYTISDAQRTIRQFGRQYDDPGQKHPEQCSRTTHEDRCRCSGNITGSDTSSCALFGGMQKDTALAVGMRPELAVASNASGGVTAKMISPQSLSVATAATNNAGQEGKLFRFTIGHSIGMTLVLCVLAYLQAGPLSWMLP